MSSWVEDSGGSWEEAKVAPKAAQWEQVLAAGLAALWVAGLKSVRVSGSGSLWVTTTAHSTGEGSGRLTERKMAEARAMAKESWKEPGSVEATLWARQRVLKLVTGSALHWVKALGEGMELGSATDSAMGSGQS